MERKIMFLSINRNIFEIMFDAKSDNISPVLEQYSVDKETLNNMLWKELNISGMEIRIANTAIDFLIDCCTQKKDLEDSLPGMIKKMILMSGVFYTNVAPNAAFTSEFHG